MAGEVRFPAEWEEQDGVLLAWPHRGTDWAEGLPEVREVFARIGAEVSRRELLLVVTEEEAEVRSELARAGAELGRVRFAAVPTNDTWARDFGPLTVLGREGPRLLDFGFNGWGLKFASDEDNQVTRRLHRAGALRPPLATVGLVLEGGSVESDGRGTLLTTAECLLGPNRNPHLTRREVEAALAEHLGATRVLWLESGRLAGDDTDAHVDTLARFAPGNTILYVACTDPADEHREDLAAMEAELRGLRTAEGEPYRLVALPWAAPKRDAAGRRLPATYANFLVVNGAVLVPTYRDAADGAALEAVARGFPGREAVGIDCLPLLEQNGSLHCVTMQLPKGVLS